MKKARDLRRHLLDSLPGLGKNPDRLLVFIEKGGIVCRAGSLGFQYGYELTLLFTDYAEHPDTLVVPLLAWIARHQPELLQKDGDTFRFEAEIIDHERSDVQITLDLTERVIVRTDAAGQLVATHCDEPAPPDLGGPTAWQLYVNGIEA